MCHYYWRYGVEEETRRQREVEERRRREERARKTEVRDRKTEKVKELVNA